MEAQDLLTTEEVAQLLRVSVQSVRRWVRQGRIEFLRIGGTIRIPASQLSKFKAAAR